MRPILLAFSSVNQRDLPSGPAVMPSGLLLAVGMPKNPVKLPLGVMRPMALPSNSVNHRLPSGPAVMPKGKLLCVGMGNSVMRPAVVMRPMLFAPTSVNQRLPSGPAVMPEGPLLAVGMGNTVKLPLVVMRPMSPSPFVISVNQRLPSGPAVIPIGALFVGMGNSLMVRALAAQAGRLLRLSRLTAAMMAVRSAVRYDRHPERFMCLPPLCMVLLIIFMRACPPRRNRVVCLGCLPCQESLARGTTTYRTGQFTVMLNCWEACTPALSVTVSVNVYVPFAVGVPLIVVPPFDPVVSARPGGSCPAVIDQV